MGPLFLCESKIDNEDNLVLIYRLYQSHKIIFVDYFFHMFESPLIWNFQGAGRKVILEVNYLISSFNTLSFVMSFEFMKACLFFV